MLMFMCSAYISVIVMCLIFFRRVMCPVEWVDSLHLIIWIGAAIFVSFICKTLDRNKK